MNDGKKTEYPNIDSLAADFIQQEGESGKQLWDMVIELAEKRSNSKAGGYGVVYRDLLRDRLLRRALKALTDGNSETWMAEKGVPFMAWLKGTLWPQEESSFQKWVKANKRTTVDISSRKRKRRIPKSVSFDSNFHRVDDDPDHSNSITMCFVMEPAAIDVLASHMANTSLRFHSELDLLALWQYGYKDFSNQIRIPGEQKTRTMRNTYGNKDPIARRLLFLNLADGETIVADETNDAAQYRVGIYASRRFWKEYGSD